MVYGDEFDFFFQLLDKFDWFFVFFLNLDGYEYLYVIVSSFFVINIIIIEIILCNENKEEVQKFKYYFLEILIFCLYLVV